MRKIFLIVEHQTALQGWQVGAVRLNYPLRSEGAPMPRLVIFLDDGGVMNDPRVRRVQWSRQVAEFFVLKLGGHTCGLDCGQQPGDYPHT